ncbi:hypothetical protein KVR01_010864 [Diaporthe batatas]|uniref:uncharacterized protein n=1 Tax=Diaporthe batatas TaxID=748121 RepID=UPI001D03FC6E|nr:uncharacterized protein KVR01_010864 [Diaporthe batatas]KAG8159203.1 hypothetical protein KVR01_010864 [Diaporthe batatas]
MFELRSEDAIIMSFPRPEKSDGFTLIVNITVKEGKLDEFLEHFWKAFKLVSAEPECLSFEVFRYPGEPNKLKWIENWSKSKEWFFENQFTKDYMKPYIEATDGLLIGERQFEIVERFGGDWAIAQEGVYKKA